MKKMTPTSIRNCELHEYFLDNFDYYYNQLSSEAFQKAYEIRSHIMNLELSETKENLLLLALKKKFKADRKAEKINESFEELLSPLEDESYAKQNKLNK